MKKINQKRLNNILRYIIFGMLILIVLLGIIKHYIDSKKVERGIIYEINRKNMS